jgi:epoxyqueuosine reductase
MEAREAEWRRRLTGLGFDDVRVASLAEPPRGALGEWLGAGMHADMDWMERTAQKRSDPQLVLPGAKSIVMLGVNYWSEQRRSNPAWARYALHADYHDTIKPALQSAGGALEEIFDASGEDYRYYVDTGPVLEREWAARAGLRFCGQKCDADLAAPWQLATARGNPDADRAHA